MDNSFRKSFKQDIPAGNSTTTSDDDIIAHTDDCVADMSDIIEEMRVLMDELDKDGIEALLDLERDVDRIEDEPKTIDHVMDLRAKFFKPTPREMIDRRIAPLLARAPEPTITERETTEDYDDFWGDIFDGISDDVPSERNSHSELSGCNGHRPPIINLEVPLTEDPIGNSARSNAPEQFDDLNTTTGVTTTGVTTTGGTTTSQ
ncbi:uncharacterized protein LOC119082009 [Bradysia coprophila]|uniref:uncharacterized protein LOC119082009 n=1 Tax=Bradysia coprophila TaxID=38358 RepID=UPI00187D96D6|nr:uncharacterized protein LOC119082009 [Bradysia coprophila]